MSTPERSESTAADTRKGGGGPFAKENRRLVIGLVIGAVVAAFAVVNLDDVEVDWLFTTSQTPLIVVIALSFILGALAGWLASAAHRRH